MLRNLLNLFAFLLGVGAALTSVASDPDLTSEEYRTLETKLQSKLLDALATPQGKRLRADMRTAEVLLAGSAQRLDDSELMREYDVTVDQFDRVHANPGGVAGVARRTGNAAGELVVQSQHRSNRKLFYRRLLDLEIYVGNVQLKSLAEEEKKLIESLVESDVEPSREKYPNLRRLSRLEQLKQIQGINTVERLVGLDAATQIKRGKLYRTTGFDFMAAEDIASVLEQYPDHPQKEELGRLLVEYRKSLP